MDLFIIGKGASRSWYGAWRPERPKAEVWTLNDASLPESTRHFDIHEDRRFWGRYDDIPCPWVVSPFAPPSALHPRMATFPLAECHRQFGRAYFESSFDYMLALALLQKRRRQIDWQRIWLPGVDMADGRHYTFRPGAHFWLGIATGMGVELRIPGPALLLKRVVDFPPTAHGDPEFPHAYGQTPASTGPVVAKYGWGR